MSEIGTIYSVKQLNEELKNLVENNYISIWVEGEIANLANPSSGHIYFSLKEENSLIRCAFFKSQQRNLTFKPESGMHVLLKGRISYYEARGDLQIVVSLLELAGEGVLRREFELLKKKLLQEGLFNSEHKKVLPPRPKSIGIITTDTGAALQDILTTLQRRYPITSVVLYPSLVQGDEAAKQLIAAIKLAQSRQEIEVLILARGGGSFEDLHAFNNEQLVREIFACDIPVVSGVGHEIDFTLTDFVADVRAPTPTGAAQLATPDKTELNNNINTQRQSLIKSWEYFYQNKQQYIDYHRARLLHPNEKLKATIQIQQHLTSRFLFSLKSNLSKQQSRLDANLNLLKQHSPLYRLIDLKTGMNQCFEYLNFSMEKKILEIQYHIEKLSEKLQLSSPQKTLTRGYAIVQNKKNDIIMNSEKTQTGESLNIHLAKGQLKVQVLDKKK